MAEGKFYTPNLLQPYQLTNSVAVFEGMAQLGMADLLRPPFTDIQIAKSVKKFVEDFTHRGNFRSLLQTYIKEDSDLDPNKFALFVHKGRYDSDNTPPFKHFYFDSFTNLVLLYGNKKNGACVTGGIELRKSIEDTEGLEDSDMQDDDLIINQLQGPTHKVEVENVGSRFSGFRWEKLLVEIFSIWTRQSGLKKIYLLPSKFSDWSEVKMNINGTSFLRYDVTARRSGFRRGNDNEPYKKECFVMPDGLFKILLEK